MAKKILFGIIIVILAAVAVLNQLVLGVFAVGVWIYLFSKIRKQKNRLSDEQTEAVILEEHLKRIKTFMIVAVISFLLFVASAIAHNVFHGLSGTEDSIFLVSSLVANLVFVLSTAGALFVFLKGRKGTT